MPTHGPKVGTKVASHAIPMPIWSSRVGMRIALEGMGGGPFGILIIFTYSQAHMRWNLSLNL